MKSFIRYFLSLFLICNLSYANAADTAALLPNAKQTFLDSNGKPLSGGKVNFYIPGTTTLKATWQDAAETVPNANPVVLDAAGRAIIYGFGSYRQLVKDKNGNIIWDQVTSSTGTGGGGSTIGDGNLVGTVLQWTGIIAPPQYLFAYGQEVARATYPEYLAAVTSVQSTFCTSSSPTLSGLTDTTQIPIGSPVEASCIPSGTTVLSKTSSTVVVSNNATTTTNVTATFFPWGNGNGTITFNLPDLRGRTLAGRDNMGGTAASRLTTTYFANASAINAVGGSQSHTQTIAEMPAHDHGGATGSAGAKSLDAAFGGDNAGAGGPRSYLNAGGGPLATADAHTHSVASQGGGAAFSIVQPTLTINYIVKVTPDVNASSASGVASISGMTGVLVCGTGLTCASNTISVTGGGGGGGSGVVGAGTTNQLAYYPSGGTTVGGTSTPNIANATGLSLNLNSSKGFINQIDPGVSGHGGIGFAENAVWTGSVWNRTDITKTAYWFNCRTLTVIPGEPDGGCALWIAAPGANPISNTYGVSGGWETGQVWTQFKDIVIGGNALEVDGNGTLPYGRFISNIVSTVKRTGTLTNIFGDFSGVDDAAQPSWFIGRQNDSAVVQRAAAGAGSALVTLSEINNAGQTTLSLNSLAPSSLPGNITGTILRLAGVNGSNARLVMDSWGSASGSVLTCRAARGTASIPTAVQSGDELCAYAGRGYGTTDYGGSVAAFNLYANQNFTDTAQGTNIKIAVTPNGSVTSVDSIKFENDGGITVPPTVTGGNKGTGTINAHGIFIDGVAVGTGTGSVTDITCNGGLTGGLITTSGTCAVDIATNSNVLAGTANKIMDAAKLYQSETTTTFSGTPTFDFNTFLNTKITLTGNISAITFSNMKAGQSGVIRFIQDATGSRTIPTTINSNLKCAGGGCNYVLSTAANAVDGLPYACIATNYCIGGALLTNIQ